MTTGDDRATVVGAGDEPPVASSYGDLSGQTLEGRYAIVKRIGVGSMGDVYEATEAQSERRVAIKVLKAERMHQGEFLHRFVREARSAALVRHPNVVEILGVGEPSSHLAYFVMEYIDGEDVATVLTRIQRFPWARCRGILAQVANALASAHRLGIVHRDIKPSNCMLVRGPVGTSDRVKLVDFGVAKLSVDMATKDLTRNADVVGTARYMSPEQVLGGAADQRSDVYALGVMAYEMVTGVAPFRGDDVFEIMSCHLRKDATPPRELVPELPEAADRLILRALEKVPEARFQSMEEFEAGLQQCGDGVAASSGSRRQEALPFAEDEFDEMPTRFFRSESDSQYARPTATPRRVASSPPSSRVASRKTTARSPIVAIHGGTPGRRSEAGSSTIAAVPRWRRAIVPFVLVPVLVSIAMAFAWALLFRALDRS